jgi:hypothetical protein
LIFSDEVTLHLYAKVNRHSGRNWGTENPHAAIEHIQDSPKLNVFNAISNKRCTDPVPSPTVSGPSYLNMMQEWLMPQVEDDSDDFINQQDGVRPYYHHLVRGYLSQHLPQ